MAGGHMHGPHGGPGSRLGLECAGVIDSAGPGVAGLRPGERVMATTNGAFAEYALCEAARTLPIPDGVADDVAATFPVAITTMHDAIVTNGGLQPGETIMIQGASSGVGLMGLQIAKLMGAGFVIGTSTNAERRARLREFGADLAVDTGDPAWPDLILAERPDGVHVTVDQVSAGVSAGNLKAAAILGRIVNVGRLGGNKGEFDFDLHAMKRIRYIGVTFRTRSAEEVRDIVVKAKADLWPALSAGKLRLPIDRRFPLDQAGEALAFMRENRHFGKIVLQA